MKMSSPYWNISPTENPIWVLQPIGKPVLENPISVFPRQSLDERVLQQTYDTEDIYGDKRKFYLPCDTTKAISMTHDVTKTYTIPYAVDNESFDQLQRLMHMMEGYISAKQFSYVFPDAYNEFQLSKIYKAARMAYRNVSSMPMSVGVAFDYMATDDFAECFEPDDFLLIVNLLDDELTLTLIKGEYDDNVAHDILDYKGVVWERHPTATISVKNKISDRIIDCLEKAGCEKAQKLYQLFGLEGLISETEKLSMLFDDASWFTISEELSEALQNLVFNIDDEISSFLMKQQEIIGDSQVHILSLVENLTGRDNFIQFMDKRSALCLIFPLIFSDTQDVPDWVRTMSIQRLCSMSWDIRMHRSP